jgi:hypothetical protein
MSILATAGLFLSATEVARLLAVSGFIAAFFCLAIGIFAAHRRKHKKRSTAATHRAVPAPLPAPPPSAPPIQAEAQPAPPPRPIATPLDLLRDPRSKRAAFALNEILSPPLALREK